MTTAAPPAALDVADRFQFAFSPGGRHAVCLRADGRGRALESWSLTAPEPVCRTVEVPVDADTTALPLDDGAILLLQRDEQGTDRYDLLRVAAGGDRAVQRLGTIPAPFGARLAGGRGRGELGLVIALDDLEHSTIWAVSTTAPALTPIVRVPGVLSVGGWLDRDAGVLALNQVSAAHRSSGIVVDLTDGTWRRVWSMSDTSVDRIVATDPLSRLLVVSTDVAGEERLGWARIGEQAVHFPDLLHRPGHPRELLALDDRGERMLVHEAAGAVSRLSVYSPAADRLDPLDIPAGTVSAPASWSGDLIRFRFSAPDCPPSLATVALGAPPRWSAAPGPRTDGPRPVPAELVELPGAAGPVEAIVHGGPGWRRSARLVVALHGGPLSSWRFESEPLFQELAAVGVAVVAPNYRGSTGYGDEHLRAVVGNWGGPDLDDVLTLGRSLARERDGLPAPVVLGASYGGFLALLAACTEPELWSSCIAMAPFLSGPRVHAAGDARVRRRVERLGGLDRIDDDHVPRDVLQRCESLTASLLLVHGSEDRTIPVEQSRTLKQRLLELGRTQGIDFEYLEVETDHDGVTRSRELRQIAVRFCLGTGHHAGSGESLHDSSTQYDPTRQPHDQLEGPQQ